MTEYGIFESEKDSKEIHVTWIDVSESKEPFELFKGQISAISTSSDDQQRMISNQRILD